MVEILPPNIFNIINNMNIKPMFCKHFIDKSQYFQKNQWLHDKALTCHSKNAQWKQMYPFAPWTSINQNSQFKYYKTYMFKKCISLVLLSSYAQFH
jgi:hypothetical protein